MVDTTYMTSKAKKSTAVRRGLTGLLCLTLANSGLARLSEAQGQGRDSGQRGGVPVPRVERDGQGGSSNATKDKPTSFGVYHVKTSRALFRACDLDADDQLLPREAAKALKNFDWTLFRSFDTNSDGRIEFDEFDARFRELALTGGDVSLQEVARQRLPSRIGEDSTYQPVLVTWFATLDVDGSDRLGKDEFEVLGKLLPTGTFQRLDKNLDDGLSIEELRPMLPNLILAEQLRPRTGSTRRQLPEEWRGADLDSDNLIDQTELERALFRIDPTLVSHGRGILQNADKNNDLFLDVIEINDALTLAARRALEAIPEAVRNKMDPAKLQELLDKIGASKK